MTDIEDEYYEPPLSDASEKLKFEPCSDEWREGLDDGLHRVPPRKSDSPLYQSGFYLGWNIALQRLQGGFDEL